MSKPHPPSLLTYALIAIAMCTLLNTLVRSVLKLGGISATVVSAVVVAVGVAWLFRHQHQRPPTAIERTLLTIFYALGLGVLYALLLLLMYSKDEPGWPGIALFVGHYLIYPSLLWLSLRPTART